MFWAIGKLVIFCFGLVRVRNGKFFIFVFFVIIMIIFFEKKLIIEDICFCFDKDVVCFFFFEIG